MKKRYILFSIVLMFLVLIGLNTKIQAADLDTIKNFTVTVDPRMNDGTLDITYEVEWLVLDSTTEGPLEWVKIGVPNPNIDTIQALTKNIKRINQFSDSYVRIDFDKSYNAGQTVKFKYSIHQSRMYTIKGSKCKYEFTPAWFTDTEVAKITVKWNSDRVQTSNTKSKQDNYLVWTKENLAKGEKIKIKVEYPKSAFTSLTKANQRKDGGTSTMFLVFVIIFVMAIMMIFIGTIGGGGYYGHRGFYGGYGYGPGIHFHHNHFGGCVRSNCACASSCASSCACACAGSGRAGCSKKDFYGTNLTTKKLKKIIQ